ncbi:ScbA/BarX family gamma-butyrolactone biosynthesis protein [Streptomyces sp. NBC_01190]|uniref:ScbA/BarX family gamma-butyrolactone biosynthesis protein n=1 Tax=Streptomyces sp. NBC_01190 TaxID=2903767 RepID=UPI00386CAD87|nr:gamma-butyrolactone biosynthesis protein [Streptomyces sp. NBC_01190]
MPQQPAIASTAGIGHRAEPPRGPEGPLPESGGELSFLQPIPRYLVHRQAVAEVFITDAVAVAEDRFLVAAQWPRDHAMYYPDEAGISDPLLFAETIRQALVYLAHRYYGVPLSHRFIGSDIDFEITDPARLRVGAAPIPVVLEAHWTWAANKPPHRYGMRLEVTLTVDGQACGRGGLRVIAVDDKRYALLRGKAARSHATARAGGSGPAATYRTPGRKMPAAAVGRLRVKDSVLARGAHEAYGATGVPGGVGVPGEAGAPGAAGRPAQPGQSGQTAESDQPAQSGQTAQPGQPVPRQDEFNQWWLALDLDHAILFDHPSDHTPLMATLEGFRQLGHLLVRESAQGAGTPGEPPALVSLATDCLAFGELDAPIGLVVREDRTAPDDRGAPVRRFVIDAVQNGKVLATSTTGWLLAHHSA